MILIEKNQPEHTAMTSYIPLILFTVVTNALAQILLKQGMNGVGAFALSPDGIAATLPKIAFSPFVFGGLLLFVVSMSSHIAVLSRVDVSFAFPFLSLAYAIVAIYAHTFLGEEISFIRALGITAIILGTILIAQSN